MEPGNLALSEASTIGIHRTHEPFKGPFTLLNLILPVNTKVSFGTRNYFSNRLSTL